MNKNFIGDFTPESYEFMRQHAEELWDFTICERPDSSRYGTADGNKCRKGFKVSRDDVLGDIKKLGVVKNPKALEKLFKLGERDFVRVTERIKQRASEEEITKGLGLKQKAAVKRVTREADKRSRKNDEDANRTGVEELSAALTTLYNDSQTGVGKSGQSLYPPEVAKLYAAFQTSDKLAVERKPISDKALDKVWESLDTKTKNSLNGKGKPPSEIKTDSERGKLILKQLIETGFKDEITGQPYSWRDLQPDHKRAITTFSPEERKNVEKGGNLVMTHKGYNGLKGSLEKQTASKKLIGDPAVNFIKKGLAEEYSKQAAKTREEFEKELKTKQTKGAAAAEMKRQIKENSGLWDTNTWKSNILGKETSSANLQAMASGVNDRDGLSARFNETGSGRGSVPRYPPANFLKMSLLINRGVPQSEWPKDLVDKSIKEATKSLRSASEFRKKYFAKKFNTFVTGGEIPEGVSNLMKEWSN